MSRPRPTVTEIRHGALRHHLNDTDALLPATAAWVTDRIHHYAQLAGVDPVAAFTDPALYSAATGRRLSPNCWGQADWATSSRLVYVDPARCRTRAAAELVTAHEIGHLRWPQARHSRLFFRNVQTLLSTAPEGPAAAPADGIRSLSTNREQPACTTEGGGIPRAPASLGRFR